jgi:taurine dioxygenase
MTATATAIKSSPVLKTTWLKPAFAVEIHDIDFNTATEEQLGEFDRLVNETAVVVVRDQALDASRVLSVAARMGRVSAQHRTGPHPDHPGITILSNKRVDGKLIGVPDAGRNWHTDGTTYEKLGLKTLLYGIECPPVGADTLIADAAAAFESLAEQRQRELEALTVVHNRATLIQKYSRAALSESDLAKMVDVFHPIVVKSDIDGRKSLFVTNGSTKSVVGMPDEAGWALVKELIAHATQDRFVYRHQWRAGDVLIWNDVGTLHQASPFDEDKYERLVYRVWVRPFATN